jgi:Na+/melibiose symporter-like transporter
MALHVPVNHHLRPLYRTLAFLGGAYVLVFGIVGIAQTSGLPFFTQDEAKWVLLLRTNPAFSVLSIVAGAVVVIAQLVGRNLDHLVNLVASVVFMVAGLAMLLLLQTDANFLAFSMSNVVASFIIGTVFGIAGLYNRSGSAEAAHAEEGFRHA